MLGYDLQKDLLTPYENGNLATVSNSVLAIIKSIESKKNEEFPSYLGAFVDAYFIHGFSSFFETPLYQQLNEKSISDCIGELVADKQSEIVEKDYNIHELYRMNKRIFDVINKRAIDWLVRQKVLQKNIYDCIIEVYDYFLNEKTFKQSYVKSFFIDKLQNAEAKFLESELDLITLKATAEMYPMYEMEIFIDENKIDIKDIFEKWNASNEMMKTHYNVNIGHFETKNLNIANKLYKQKMKQLNTRKKFTKNIDGYSGEFLSSKILDKAYFVVGEANDKQKQ
ncbi:hypothetical protein I5R57_10845 [Staphylococcus haemolyticus]|uniref:hypothetical protein n=1 Tax=Staphylococcus haemolyticus TaxID=1283 RepID=UPI0018C6A4A5|nr:hypothetical protein [Staphylococcus haemolyticus]MBG3870463.1 hypothetical protein [Staphylococcus haemolyticus]